MKPRFFFNIDVLGSCNLRCPSCPQGNTPEYRLEKGLMGVELLQQIVEKAKRECTVTGIGLFNWTEPLLHPQLPELIRVVEDAGVSCYISSHLNTLRDPDALMAANPYSFRISCSGFTQETYGFTHRGGDIDQVQRNMERLASAKKRQKAKTQIHVLYHRYKHNLNEEPMMRGFAQSLGFEFRPVWAFMMPLEKILSEAEDDHAQLTANDKQLISKLALPVKEALAVCKPYRDRPCELQQSAITMDFKGDVQLCCAVFDARKFTVGNYLDLPLAEIQQRKEAHAMCGRCSAHGAHIYVTYGAQELDEVAARTVSEEDADLLGLSAERRQNRIRHKLERLGSYLTPEQSAWFGRWYDKIGDAVRARL